MKKIIGILLAITVAFGSFSAFAEEKKANTLTPETENAITLLEALGIETVSRGTEKYNVTRQEFAESIYRVLAGAGFGEGMAEAAAFSDVTDAKYIPYVNALARLKILSGYSDGTFRPMNTVSLNEAFTVIVRMLGYDVIAEANGGYPGGYYLTAVNLGIAKGIDLSAESLTFGDLAIILKNTLLADVKTKNSFSSDGKIEFSDETTSLLYSVHKIDIIKDIVNGIDITKLSGESSVPPWNILVGDKLLDIGKLEPNELLGYSVEAYYNYETDTLVHIEKTKKNTDKVIDVTDIIRIENNEIVTIVNGKEFKDRYSALVDFVYNNGATEEALDLSLFDRKNGTVALIDNNGDKVYDVVKADVYYDVVVDYVSPAERKVYDLATGKAVSIDNRGANPYVVLDDGEGGSFNADNLAKYNVLSVYETLADASQQYIRIVKSNSIANGVVNSIEEDDNGRVRVTVGSNTVLLTGAAKNDYLSLIKAGESTSLLINADGKAAGVAYYLEGAFKYGVVMHCAVQTKDLETICYARIFNQQDQAQDVYFADNVIIDGIQYRENDPDILKHLKASAKAAGTVQKTNDERYMQLIRYSLDPKGKFSVIDTVLNSYDAASETGVAASISDEPDSSNSLYLGPSSPYDHCEFLYQARAINYGNGVLVGSNTIAFGCPGVNEAYKTDYIDEANYSYAGNSISSSDTRFSSYYANPEDITASAIVYHYSIGGGSGNTSTDWFGVFDKITRGVDANGEISDKVYYWYQGEYRSDYAASTAGFTDTEGKLGSKGKRYRISDLKEGDAVRFTWNNDGKISSFYIYARAEGDIKVGADQWPTQFRNKNRRVSGYVYKIYENGLGFVVGEDKSVLEGKPQSEQVRDTVPVVVYDSSQREGHRLEKGSFKSAVSYLKDKENCSRIYLNTNGGSALMVYIVR